MDDNVCVTNCNRTVWRNVVPVYRVNILSMANLYRVWPWRARMGTGVYSAIFDGLEG
jgi:hypothetical protein